MKVILKEYVYMHGVAGDVVDVANGFARNYLIPQGKAERATPHALARNQQLMEEAAKRRTELNAQLLEVSNVLNGTELVFGRKAGRNNKLYGSVTTMDIAKALHEKTGIDINRRRISERSLREIGEFEVPIRMGADLAPVVRIVIVPEDEVENYLSGQEVEALTKAAEEKEAELEAEADENAEETAADDTVVATSVEETVVGTATESFEASAEEADED